MNGKKTKSIHLKMQTNNLHLERAKREKTLTFCCQHCCSVFSSLESPNADWLQHVSLRASVDFSCCFVVQRMTRHVPVPEGTTKGVCSISKYTYCTLNCGLIYGFKHWNLPVPLRKTDLNHFISFHFHHLCFPLSSSPSLDHTLSWLKEQRRKLVI